MRTLLSCAGSSAPSRTVPPASHRHAPLPGAIRLSLLAGATIALAGCQSVFERRDTVSLHAGDAVAWNRSVHTIDPWPVAAQDTTIPVSGRRVAQAIENYETSLAAPAAAPSISLVPMAPLAPGGGASK